MLSNNNISKIVACFNMGVAPEKAVRIPRTGQSEQPGSPQDVCASGRNQLDSLAAIALPIGDPTPITVSGELI
jgi:hypothetical protein